VTFASMDPHGEVENVKSFWEGKASRSGRPVLNQPIKQLHAGRADTFDETRLDDCQQGSIDHDGHC
jgi:hypothetical protein